MAIEAYKYGDPAEILDRMREEEKREAKRRYRERQHKSRRIQALVKQAMKGERR